MRHHVYLIECRWRRSFIYISTWSDLFIPNIRYFLQGI